MSEFAQNIAIVIGINHYRHGIEPLKNAVNDAQAISALLETQHQYKVLSFLDRDANLENLRHLIEVTLPDLVTADDRLLFYFAGHGIALNSDADPAGYLIPCDADKGKTETYLPMTALQIALEALPCRHFLGILDCCYAGAFRWGSSQRDLLAAPEVIYKERYDRFIQDPAWQIITSSAADQTSFDSFALDTERGQGKHSPFATALIEALQGAADRIVPKSGNRKSIGDGIITATELYLYLRDRVELPTEASRNRQTPQLWSLNKHDKGEFIFFAPGQQLKLESAPALDESKNPYRGLESFEAVHQDLFFGRSAIASELTAFVQNHPLTVVLGASGSGKSSLVKAGLIPQLQAASETKWTTLVMRPGKSPFAALKHTLNQDLTVQISYVTLLSTWKQQNPNHELLLIIDQCEELITLCQDEQERSTFLVELRTAIAAHSDILRVVLTLRSDFEPQLQDFVLKDLWQPARFHVPAMSRLELQDAIEKPAEVRVIYFESDELVQQLIDDVADMPGSLPLLSFALSELYLNFLKRQQEASYRGIILDRAIIQADYDALGGVTRSLTQRADQECDRLGSDYSQTIKNVMLRMVAIGSGELARRRVSDIELSYSAAKGEQVKTVVDQFSAARLLVKGQDIEGNPYVEPAHDALIQGWGKLRDWVNSEKNLDLQRRLTPAALTWKTTQQRRFLWNADPYLEVLNKEILNSPNNNWLNQVETEFVQRSIKRKQLNVRTRWGIAFAVMLGLSGLAIAARIGQVNATIGQMLANTQTAEASLQSDQVTLDALISSLRAGQALQDLRQQIAFKPNQEQQSQVIRTLRKAIFTVRETNRLTGFPGGVQEVFWRNDQLLVAGTERDGSVHVWDRNAQSLAELPAPANSVIEVQFSPDGNLLAIALNNGKIRLWNWQQNQVTEWQAHQDKVNSIRFRPDGAVLASAGGRTAHLWNLSGKSLRQFSHPRNPFLGVGFDKNAQLLIITASEQSQSKRIQLLNSSGRVVNQQDIENVGSITDMSAVLSSNGEDAAIHDGERSLLWNIQSRGYRVLGADTIVAFNRENTQLATTGSEDGTVSLRNDTGTTTTELKGYQGRVVSLNFKADNRVLAAASSDGTVRLWGLAPQPLKLVKQLPGVIKRTGFRPDGQLVAQTSDGKLHWFDQSGNLLNDSSATFPPFTTFSFHPQSQQLIASAENGLHFVEASGNSSKVLAGNYRGNVSFSPNGQQFAAIVGDDRTISTLR